MRHEYGAAPRRRAPPDERAERVRARGIKMLRTLVDQVDGSRMERDSREKQAAPLAPGNREPAASEFRKMSTMSTFSGIDFRSA